MKLLKKSLTTGILRKDGRFNLSLLKTIRTIFNVVSLDFQTINYTIRYMYNNLGVNRIILRGYIVSLPTLCEYHNTRTGTSFKVVTEESFTKKGVREVQSETHNIIVPNRLIDGMEAPIGMKSEVFLEGKIEGKSHFDSNGIRRYHTDVVVNKIELVTSRQASS